MGLEPSDHTNRGRRSILQEVYEENLDIDGPSRRRKRRATARGVQRDKALRDEGPRLSRWERAAMLAFSLVLVVVTGWAYQRFTATADPLPAPETPAPALPVSAPFPRTSSREAPAGLSGHAAVSPPAGFSVAGLFGLEVKTIVIDAGHGGKHPGAVGPTGLKEKGVTLGVARRLRARLERHPGYRILMTRAWDETMSLRERVQFANSHDADLFISIHVNWLPVERVTSIETYYFGRGDADALALARRENQHSGYSVADFNEMIDRVGSTMRLQESRRLARAIQRNLYQNVRTIDEDVDDWGVKTAPFVVIMGTEAPSVLAEIGVLSNHEQEQRLKTSAYREKLAAFLEAGIVDYLSRGVPVASQQRTR